MGDFSFEARLQRLFAEVPPFADSPAFAAQVEARLDRGWAVRRVAIAAAGLLGGGIAVVQLVGSDLPGRLELASRSSTVAAGRQVGLAVEGLGRLTPAFRALPLGGETLWLIAGLGALALALLATRVIEEL